MAEVTFDYLSRKVDQLLDQNRQLREDVRQGLENQVLAQRTITNLDRRLSDVKDELELSIKMEIGGEAVERELQLLETR